MRRFAFTMLGASIACAAQAQSTEKFTVTSGAVEVPIEVARPAGRGPFAPVLYIHAKRGFEDVDREHMRALAADGFLVLAPDWLAGNMLELRSADGQRVIAMSLQARESLDDEQVAAIERHARIISAPIDHIESSAGGSVRCMLAEVHLPRIVA